MWKRAGAAERRDHPRRAENPRNAQICCYHGPPRAATPRSLARGDGQEEAGCRGHARVRGRRGWSTEIRWDWWTPAPTQSYTPDINIFFSITIAN